MTTNTTNITVNAVQQPQPLIITISASISGGKTTTIDQIWQHYSTNKDQYNFELVIAKENLDAWKSDHGMNWFDLFYRNQERWSCTFQFKVMQTQFEMLSKLKEEHLAAKSGKPLVIITERSPLDGLEIFSDTLKADGAMTEAEYQLVKWYSSQFLWLPNQVFFLDVSEEECYKRIVERDRKSENLMKRSYSDRLVQRHKSVFGQQEGVSNVAASYGVKTVTLQNSEPAHIDLNVQTILNYISANVII